jgi:ABC-type Fe3+ transport system substrate-binding protein
MRRRWTTGLALATALSLLAAACGDNEPTDTTVDAATTTTSEVDGETTTTTPGDEWQSGDDWDAGAPAEWAEILAAAQEEGVVVVGGFPFLEEPMQEAFERDTGIQLEYVGGGGGDISARFEQEIRADNSTIDLILGGGGELETLYPDDLLGNIRELMILPGVQDGPWWRLGARQWYDDEQAYLLEASGWVFGYITVNPELVDPDSINTWEDLLRPELTGQIIAYDPLAIGAGQGAASAMVGSGVSLDYLEDLFVGQEVDFVEDNTQVVEALARGTHAVALFALQSQIERFRSEGFELEVVLPDDYPGYVSSGFSVLKLAPNAPHPNAAQVFINWYASVPGQQVYQDVLLETSNRLDVDRSNLPDYVVPQEGVDYFEDSTEEFRLTIRRNAVDELFEILGGR